MIKKLIAGIALCVHVAVVFAQHQLTVEVFNGDQPMAGASVGLSGTPYSGQTDVQGNVHIRNLKTATYVVYVSYLGFQTQHREITVSADEQIRISMERAPLLTDEVVVLATRATENAATTYKNLNKADIAKNNLGQDIPYLLDQTPGVVISSDAGAGIGYTSMRIRGSDGQRTNVT